MSTRLRLAVLQLEQECEQLPPFSEVRARLLAVLAELRALAGGKA